MHYCSSLSGIQPAQKKITNPQTHALSPLFMFCFFHSTYHYNVPYILLIYLVSLSQPQCKLSEARGFSFVHCCCVPGSQKEECLVV